MTHTVYHVTGPDIGNGYVGCTSRPLKERWKEHDHRAPGRIITPLRQTEDPEVAADLEALYIILKDTLHPAGLNHTRNGKVHTRAKDRSEDYHARHVEHMRKLNADLVVKAAAAERMRNMHTDPEWKAAAAERMRKRQADPEFQAKRKAGIEAYQARAKAAKEQL